MKKMVIALLGGILLLWCTPLFLSSSWGRGLSIFILQKITGEPWEVREFSFGWFSPTSLSHLSLKGEDLSIEKINLEASFFDLLIYRNFWEKGISIQDAKIQHREVLLNVDHASFEPPFHFTAQGTTSSQEKQGNFSIDVKIHETSFFTKIPLSLESFKKNLSKIEIDAQVTSFPTLFLDEMVAHLWPDYRDIPTLFCGDRLDVNICNDNHLFSLHIHAPLLQGELSFKDNLFSEWHLSGKMAYLLGNKFILNIENNQLFLHSDTLSLARASFVPYFPYIAIEKENPLCFTLLPQVLESTSCHLNRKVTFIFSQDHFLTEEECTFSCGGCSFTLAPIQGESYQGSWHISCILKKGSWKEEEVVREPVRLTLSLSHQKVEGSLTSSGEVFGSFSGKQKGGNFLIESPALFTFSPQHPIFSFLAVKKPITLTISHLLLPLSNIYTAKISGEVHAPLLEWLSDGSCLKEGRLSFSFNGPQQHGSLSLKALSIYGMGKEEHRQQLQVDGDHLFSPNTTVYYSLQASSLPTSFFSTYFSPDLIPYLLGETLSIESHGKFLKATPWEGFLFFKGHSPNIDIHLNLLLKEHLTLNEKEGPSSVVVTLSPQAFSLLHPQASIALLSPTRLALHIEALTIPWEGLYHFNPFLSSLKASLQTHDITFTDSRTKITSSLEPFSGNIYWTNSLENIFFEAKAGKTLSLQGAVAHAFDCDLHVNTEELTLEVQAQGKEIYVPLFCELLWIDSAISPKISALLGNNINFDIETHIHHARGPIKAHLEGENGSFYLSGGFRDNGLELYEDLLFSVKATPLLGKEILKDIVPMFSGLEGGEAPLSIEIKKEGVFIPLTSFSLAHTTLPHLTFTLGKLWFRKDGDFLDLLEIFKYNKKEERISVWATPIFASLKEGFLTVSRFDLLLMKNYEIAIWGNVNFRKDNVHFIIGLPSSSLYKAFNIKLPKAYMMQIPLTGTLEKTHLNKRAAFAQIAALLTKKNSATGLIIGTFLDVAGGKFTEERPPLPTTTPFPWEGL